MTRRPRIVLCLWVGLIVLTGWTPSPVHAHDPQGVPPRIAPGNAGSPARSYFSDVILLDQDGKRRRFYTDLLKGKVVVINSFYATCTEACPLIMATLAKMQEALGDRLGKEVHFLSLSLDPGTDTPPRLKAYAERLHARPNWHFLTGKKENVDWALYRLGQYVESKEEHLNLLVIGNERTGQWRKAFALARPDDLVRIVESVMGAE